MPDVAEKLVDAASKEVENLSEENEKREAEKHLAKQAK